MIKLFFWLVVPEEGQIFEFEADFDLMISELGAYDLFDPKVSLVVESFLNWLEAPNCLPQLSQ